MRLSCQEDSRCFWLAPKQMNQLVTYMLQTIEPKINCLTTTLDMDKERTRLQRGLVCGGWKDDFSAGTLHSDFQQLITRIQSSLDVANLLKQLQTFSSSFGCLLSGVCTETHHFQITQALGTRVKLQDSQCELSFSCRQSFQENHMHSIKPTRARNKYH